MRLLPVRLNTEPSQAQQIARVDMFTMCSIQTTNKPGEHGSFLAILVRTKPGTIPYQKTCLQAPPRSAAPTTTAGSASGRPQPRWRGGRGRRRGSGRGAQRGRSRGGPSPWRPRTRSDGQKVPQGEALGDARLSSEAAVQRRQTARPADPPGPPAPTSQLQTSRPADCNHCNCDHMLFQNLY